MVQDAAKMGIELVPNGNEFMSYYIVNHTDQYLECSYWRKLEICNDGEWYEFGGNPWILSSEMIGPDGTQQMEDAWLQQYYPELDEGEYRILLHMCFHEAPDEWMTNEPDENDMLRVLFRHDHRHGTGLPDAFKHIEDFLLAFRIERRSRFVKDDERCIFVESTGKSKLLRF